MCLAITVVKKIVHCTKNFIYGVYFIGVQLYFHNSKLNYFCYTHKPNLSIFNSISCSSVVSNFNFLPATQSVFVI